MSLKCIGLARLLINPSLAVNGEIRLGTDVSLDAKPQEQEKIKDFIQLIIVIIIFNLIEYFKCVIHGAGQ